ncbi:MULTISPECIES: hypothetical protein, partial [unclassified Endozoicomonas]|uniref:hypothetical protein n=1 Tax=unclassified Endozoicomonas TaxID=2644528 RepID=UPI0021471F7A
SAPSSESPIFIGLFVVLGVAFVMPVSPFIIFWSFNFRTGKNRKNAHFWPFWCFFLFLFS